MESSSDIDAFTAAFPLPYRVLFLAGMGILGWATNIHGLHLLGVDAISALELKTAEPHQPMSPLPSHRPPLQLGYYMATLYRPVYHLFFAYSAWCIGSWSLFRVITQGRLLLVDVFAYIPAVTALSATIILVCPFEIFQKQERDKFLHSIRRCVTSTFDRPVYFADVVFADIFTSFAKVLGDMWLSFAMLLPGSTLLITPSQDGWARWIVPAIMSLPYLTRFRQCIVEYNQPTNSSRRPLWNALKYATSFPVIFLSAAQRIVVTELVEEQGAEAAREAWHGEHPVFRLWLLAAAINSLYSFWWDITNDWGLSLLSKNEEQIRPPPSGLRRLVLPLLHSRSSSLTVPSRPGSPSVDRDLVGMSNAPEDSYGRTREAYPWGLRPTLLYPLPIYPFIILINLVLRLTWSIKLSSHLHSQSDGSVTIFWLEMAEVVRRWMWVFIRVEWEVIKKARSVRNTPTTSEDGDEQFELVHAHDPHEP